MPAGQWGPRVAGRNQGGHLTPSLCQSAHLSIQRIKKRCQGNQRTLFFHRPGVILTWCVAISQEAKFVVFPSGMTSASSWERGRSELIPILFWSTPFGCSWALHPLRGTEMVMWKLSPCQGQKFPGRLCIISSDVFITGTQLPENKNRVYWLQQARICSLGINKLSGAWKKGNQLCFLSAPRAKHTVPGVHLRYLL